MNFYNNSLLFIVHVIDSLMQSVYQIFNHKYPKYLGREFSHGHYLSHNFLPQSLLFLATALSCELQLIHEMRAERVLSSELN